MRTEYSPPALHERAKNSPGIASAHIPISGLFPRTI